MNSMLLYELILTNYRNYKKYKVDLDKITVFVGKNGVGKSNIIEAIFVLGFAKSFRTNHDEALIYHDQTYAQIEAKTKIGEYNFVLQKNLGKLVKQIAIDKNRLSITKLVGQLKIVLFDPESLEIVTGSPGQRRKYLDMVISQIDKNYLSVLIEYKKILRSRNEILKNISIRRANEKELVFWDKKLIENAKIIIKKRIKLCQFVQKNINDFYKSIAQKDKVNIDVKYLTSCENEDRFDQYLSMMRPKEIVWGKTLAGPHLDDIRITYSGKIAQDTCSRGEVRTIALALKIAEIEYLKTNQKNEEILLLLDDIFSELDKDRREQVIKIISDHQTVITTTDEDFVKNNLGKIKLIGLK